jgi:hypothetical protein
MQAPRRRKRRNRGVLIAAWSVAGLALAAIIISVSSGAGKTPAPSPSHAVVAAKAPGSSSKAIAACYKRPAGAELYVRTSEPGTQAIAQEIGGEWGWDYTTSQCLDAMDDTIATAGTASGECTQAGYVADNPGYDANAVPAPALSNVADEAGPGC